MKNIFLLGCNQIRQQSVDPVILYTFPLFHKFSMSGENETVAQPFKCFQGKGSKLKGYLGILILESDLKKKT